MQGKLKEKCWKREQRMWWESQGEAHKSDNKM
jgi:hypothetical protein